MEGCKGKKQGKKSSGGTPFWNNKDVDGEVHFFAKRGGKSQAEFDYYAATYNQKRLIGCAQTSDVMAKMGKSSQ